MFPTDFRCKPYEKYANNPFGPIILDGIKSLNGVEGRSMHGQQFRSHYQACESYFDNFCISIVFSSPNSIAKSNFRFMDFRITWVFRIHFISRGIGGVLELFLFHSLKNITAEEFWKNFEFCEHVHPISFLSLYARPRSELE